MMLTIIEPILRHNIMLIITPSMPRHDDDADSPRAATADADAAMPYHHSAIAADADAAKMPLTPSLRCFRASA